MALSLLLLTVGITANAQLAGWGIYAPYAFPRPNYTYTSCSTPLGGTAPYSITKVVTTGGITNINNSSGCVSNVTDSNYTYYAGQILTVNAGSTISLTITSNNSSGNTTGFVWIDWQHKGYFDPITDRVSVTPSSANYFSAATWSVSITIPSWAQNGKTRMRVAIGSTGSSPAQPGTGPLANIKAGETEDYDVEIINPCLQPAVIGIANVTCNSADISWSTRGNATFYDVWVDTVLAPWSRTDAPDCAPGPPYCKGGAPCYCKWWHKFGPTSTSTHLPGTVNSQLLSNRKYYVCIRTICDTFQKPLFWTWDTSAVWAIDSFTTLPCCEKPDPVSISDITSTSATATWTPVYTAIGYEYVVNLSPADPVGHGPITTFTSAPLTGLASSKTYYFHVRSLCSPTPQSDWTTVSFGTLNTTGVGTLAPSNVSLYAYPNPVKNEVTIELGGMYNGAAHVEITDMTGKLVKTVVMEDGRVTIQTIGWAPGLYFVKYMDRQNTAVTKISKQ